MIRFSSFTVYLFLSTLPTLLNASEGYGENTPPSMITPPTQQSSWKNQPRRFANQLTRPFRAVRRSVTNVGKNIARSGNRVIQGAQNIKNNIFWKNQLTPEQRKRRQEILKYEFPEIDRTLKTFDAMIIKREKKLLDNMVKIRKILLDFRKNALYTLAND